MKLNPIYEAITYLWVDMDNGKLYLGFHKTDEENDGYVFSSEDESLNDAWTYGRLRRHVVYRGTVSECITLENFTLKEFDATKNPLFYNKSKGGGVGCVRDFSNLSEELKQHSINCILGNFPIYEEVDTDVDVEQCKRIKVNIDNTRYKIHQREDTNYIYSLPRNQVREEAIDPEHVAKIKDKMLDNPAKARMHISPIIVIVFPDGSMQLIDGNHTIRAAHDMDWKTISVIYINSSEFNDKKCNIDWFGYWMNHREQVTKGNESSDLRKAIMNYTNTHPHLKLGTEEFKLSFMKGYSEIWSKKQIAATLKSVKSQLETLEQIKKNNFKIYSDSELKKIVDTKQKENPNVAVISIAASTCMNAGVGGVANKMGGMDNWEAIMVISYRHMDDYLNRKVYKKKLKDSMLRLHPKCNVTLEYLEPFIKLN